VSAGRDGRLLRAVAENHRRWFRERGEANCFPEAGLDVEEFVRGVREGDLPAIGVWSLGRDDELGVRLVARGFDWGWRPHWMGVELDEEPEALADIAAQSGFEVELATPPFATTLPYREDGPLPEGAIHLGVRLREKVVGQVVVFPLDGIAGIYSMGVAPKAQGRGIGLALTRAALRTAWDAGCRAAVLNATPAGELVYARAGFRSLGWGQTWWYARGPEPTARQIALLEAVGFGDVAALEALGPSPTEATGAAQADRNAPPVSDRERSAGTAPLALAAVTGQSGSVDFLLDRFPTLAASRFPPHGGNLLHVAVEHDRPKIVAAALRRGVDPDARDESYDATPAGWAEHLGRPEIARLLADV
jgi:ribosomal protein S18 acetylase RimI-like enzyme